jgi:hypothetical protein
MKEAEVALAFIRSGGADEVNIFFDCEEVFASFDRRRISYCRIEDFAAPRAEGSASNWGFIKFRDNGTVEKILENACSENGEQFVECDIEEVR